MLSDDQKNVLVLLRDLSQSALSLSEQTGYVTMVNEAILKLEDGADEARLLGAHDAEHENFVELARRRLIEAQKSALARYDARRLVKVARRETSDDTDLNAEAEPSAESALTPESEEDVAQGVREAKSESITTVLQRMHELAQAEILKGELNISELDMSSRTLRELQERYSGVDVLLNGSKRLVKVLDEADKWDRRCMQASLAFLAAVLVYIIYRRILSGPIKILLWSLFQFVGLVRWAVPQNSLQAAPPVQDTSAAVLFASHTEIGKPVLASDTAAGLETAFDLTATTVGQETPNTSGPAPIVDAPFESPSHDAIHIPPDELGPETPVTQNMEGIEHAEL